MTPRSFEVDYHLKCCRSLCFPGFGLPLGLPFATLMARSGKILGLIASLILILIFFVSQVVFRTFGVNGILGPVLGGLGAEYRLSALGRGSFSIAGPLRHYPHAEVNPGLHAKKPFSSG